MRLTFKERVYWNSKSYGQYLVIKCRNVKLILTGLVIILPLTPELFLIPMINRRIKRDLVIRIDIKEVIENAKRHIKLDGSARSAIFKRIGLCY